MRDLALGLRYGRPKPYALCAWCGTDLGTHRTVAIEGDGDDALVFCSAACAATRHDHLTKRTTTPRAAA